MVKKELIEKVAKIKATLPKEYQEIFQEHCDKSLSLQLTLRKERTKDEWIEFLDKKKKKPIETIYLIDEKTGNRKVDSRTGKELVNLSLSYEEIIKHKDFNDISDERRKKEIILLKVIGTLANAKAEVEVIGEYLGYNKEKIESLYDALIKGNSLIKSRYSTKKSEIKAQLGMRTRGEKQRKENIEITDLIEQFV